MRIRTPNQNPVFLDDAEPRGRFAGAGQGTGPAVRAERGDERGALRGDAGAPGEDVQGDALAEEDLADGAADGRDVGYGGVDGLAFLDVPFHSGWVGWLG
ncbi:uncharacterized protein LDX57_006608 [Aspergillus melleus]|uniref:uncharacterized protein n=1 Tax=Aspergillus melleus TaxID=138277 RepID=UPI001E8EC616|nr:uncharacterized protein LDX57_006608 [Aspergillus melleus]KAH8428935.1 hypothetical protein LDX57_006608 [Aspergillus melleus]